MTGTGDAFGQRVHNDDCDVKLTNLLRHAQRSTSRVLVLLCFLAFNGLLARTDAVRECPADTNPTRSGNATATDARPTPTVKDSDKATNRRKPTITCARDKTVECTSAWSFDPPAACETCGQVTITIVSTSTNFSGHCGQTFEATRTWRVANEGGNFAECQQKVTVEDAATPTITCVGNKTVECTATWTFDPPAARDTCGNVTLTVVSTTTNITGHSGQTFDATRIWRATDDCGNFVECSQQVTVQDTR